MEKKPGNREDKYKSLKKKKRKGFKGVSYHEFMTRLFQSFIKSRFSVTTFCACANFVNINISANALWQSPLKSYDFK